MPAGMTQKPPQTAGLIPLRFKTGKPLRSFQKYTKTQMLEILQSITSQIDIPDRVSLPQRAIQRHYPRKKTHTEAFRSYGLWRVLRQMIQSQIALRDLRAIHKNSQPQFEHKKPEDKILIRPVRPILSPRQNFINKILIE
jgi:hypothetical protein